MSMEKEVSKFRRDYWTFEETFKKPTLLHFWQILGTKKACLHLHTKAWSFDRQEEDKQQLENCLYCSIS